MRAALDTPQRAVMFGADVVTVPDVGDQVAFTHMWDGLDADRYLAATTRVSSVGDRFGGRELHKDRGAYGALFSLPTLEGPLWIQSSARFNGRPAWRGDFVSGIVFTELSPHDDPTDPNDWFNPPTGYPQPYWLAVLGRLATVPGGLSDAQQGSIGTTVSIIGDANPAPPHNWGATTGLSDAWPSSGILQSLDETTLAIVEANGASSFIEINKRNAAGSIITNRVAVTLTNRTAKELFFGLVHDAYVTWAALKTGTSTIAETNAVRAWAAPYMPPAGALPAEP